jgi:GPH family glycoside/pentoside/hexuronide:cation symporter
MARYFAHFASALLVAAAISAGPLVHAGPTAPAGPTASAGSYRRPGLNFSPYAGSQDPTAGAVVDDAQIARRLQPLVGRTKAIRTFGARGGLERIAPLASARGFEVWAGAWISSNLAANEREITNLIAIGRAGQARVLVVGSEVLLRNDLPAGGLIGYLKRVRAAVPPQVRVTTAETYAKLLEHPDVIEACDIVFFNVHPYWEGVAVEAAVAMVERRWRLVTSAARGKRTVIAEVGWPSGGAARGTAVPSPGNAARFFQEFTSWARTRSVDYFWFEAADEAWKARHEGEVGAHWGLWLADGVTFKPGMHAVFDGRRVADIGTSRMPAARGDAPTPGATAGSTQRR